MKGSPDAYVDGALGHALQLQRQFEKALVPLERCVRRAPTYRPCHVWQAVAAAHLRRSAHALNAGAQVLRIEPQFTIRKWLDFVKYVRLVNAELLRDGMRKAGLPE